MRSLLQSIINALLSADADAVVGAEWGRPTPGRTAQRNGYRHRDLDTRVGTIDVAIPKLRTGTYFPQWLLERRKRAESALITVVADCYLAGVSTRRMDKLVKTLGIDSLTKSQVSRMATDLDQHRRRVPAPPAGRGRPVHVRGRRRADDEGPRRRPRRQRCGAAGHRRQRRRTPRGPGHARGHHRDRAGVERVLRRPRRPRPGRGPARHHRRPRRAASRRSRRTCPAPLGSAAAPTTPPT